MKHHVASLRKEYAREQLTEDGVQQDPLGQFASWFDEAMASELPEPTAMILATADASGQPSARAVLLKGVDERGFVWYTNYASRKGAQLAENPQAALLFFWPELERQIRIEGTVERVSDAEIQEYFASRPHESKIGAWASDQSAVIDSQEALQQKFANVSKHFENKDVPPPPTWGGYRLRPHMYEFWQGRPSRLHDRLRYTRTSEEWKLERLQP